MKRFLSLTIIALALAMLTWAPSALADSGTHIVVNVFQDTGHITAAGGYSPIRSDVQYVVFDAGAETLHTLRGSDGQIIRNPVSTTQFDADERIDFWTEEGTSSVDILIIHNTGGFCTWLNGATRSTRTAIIDEKVGQHHGMIWYTMESSDMPHQPTAATSDTLDGTKDTLVRFNPGTILQDMMIEVLVITTGSNVGLAVGGGSTATPDTDLFLDVMDPEGGGAHLEGHAGLRIATASTSLMYGDAFKLVQGADNMSIEDGTEDASLYMNIMQPQTYLMETTYSLTYSVSSGVEGTWPTVPGWGFIHYWFTNFRP